MKVEPSMGAALKRNISEKPRRINFRNSASLSEKGPAVGEQSSRNANVPRNITSYHN